jgi:hypothetical protein
MIRPEPRHFTLKIQLEVTATLNVRTELSFAELITLTPGEIDNDKADCLRRKDKHEKAGAQCINEAMAALRGLRNAQCTSLSGKPIERKAERVCCGCDSLRSFPHNGPSE